MYLGDYISIEEQTGPHSFSCMCVSTGTAFTATIDQDKKNFFDDHSFPDQHPSACRFLRPLGEGKIGCTIHTDSPAQCKHYRCVVIRISIPDKGEIGYVTGTLALHSEDQALLTLWEQLRRKVPEKTDEEEIESILCDRLKQAGYQVT